MLALAFMAAMKKILWHVDRNLVGKIFAGMMMKVVVMLGLKLAKKKVNLYMMIDEADVVAFGSPVVVRDDESEHEDHHHDKADELELEPAQDIDERDDELVAKQIKGQSSSGARAIL